jgi:hypothetical protein
MGAFLPKMFWQGTNIYRVLGVKILEILGDALRICLKSMAWHGKDLLVVHVKFTNNSSSAQAF